MKRYGEDGDWGVFPNAPVVLASEADAALAALSAELERVNAAHAVTERNACALAEALDAAEQRVKELEKDAARYRWLRDGNMRNAGNCRALEIASDQYGHRWDELIDAAISSATQGEKL